MTIVTVTLNPSVDAAFEVEALRADQKLATQGLRRDPGGGGINVARVAARLGRDARALWSRGGCDGDRLHRLLDRDRVAHRPVPIDGEIRENLMVTETSTGERFRFGLPGPELGAEDRDRWRAALRDATTDADFVVFSGSFPGEADPGWYATLLRTVPEHAQIVVDTRGAALRAALDVGVFLVKPNVRELETIAGRDLPDVDAIATAARELVAAGRATVALVSLGADGALLATADGAIRLPSPRVTAVSTIGAGDSMVGGLVQALDAGAGLRTAARQAVAAGAAAVLTPGTELCRPEDVARLVTALPPEEMLR